MFETIDKYMLSHVDIDDLAASVKYKRAFRKANPTYFEPDGILVFCGPQGSGKTLSAVRYVLDLLRAFPRAILCSNVRIHGLPESVRYVPYPGVFDATYPLSQTIDFTHPAHVGYTTYKNWFYSTGNSTPYTLRGWIRYYGPDIQVRWSTGSSAGSYSSLSMSSGSQNGGCVYSSATSDWYDRIKVTIQPTFILPDQDYYLTVAGNAVGSFLSPVADDSAFVFKQLSQVKYSDTQFICTYSVRNTSTETKKLTSVEFSTSSSGGFTLSSFTVSPYSSSSEDVIAAIQKQTNDIIDNQNQHYQDTENKFQGAVNPGQAGANQEIQNHVGQLEDFDNQIFTDVSDYTSQLDFGLGDWSEAAAGISYIGSIFMLIWDNSPMVSVS